MFVPVISNAAPATVSFDGIVEQASVAAPQEEPVPWPLPVDALSGGEHGEGKLQSQVTVAARKVAARLAASKKRRRAAIVTKPGGCEVTTASVAADGTTLKMTAGKKTKMKKGASVKLAVRSKPGVVTRSSAKRGEGAISIGAR